MKRLVTTLALLVVCAGTASAANQMRISQVYGGGGGTTGVYTRDFVELYNSGVTPVNIGGWTIQYGSATGAWGSSTGNIFNRDTRFFRDIPRENLPFRFRDRPPDSRSRSIPLRMFSSVLAPKPFRSARW